MHTSTLEPGNPANHNPPFDPVRIVRLQDGGPKNPRAVGEAIQAALPTHPAVQSTSIAGPGFVNVVLSNAWLAERIDGMLVNGISTWAPVLQVSGDLLLQITGPICWLWLQSSRSDTCGDHSMC